MTNDDYTDERVECLLPNGVFRGVARSYWDGRWTIRLDDYNPKFTYRMAEVHHSKVRRLSLLELMAEAANAPND